MSERYAVCPICAGRGKIPEMVSEEIVNATEPSINSVLDGFTIEVTYKQRFEYHDCGRCGSTGFDGAVVNYKG